MILLQYADSSYEFIETTEISLSELPGMMNNFEFTPNPDPPTVLNNCIDNLGRTQLIS